MTITLVTSRTERETATVNEAAADSSAQAGGRLAIQATGAGAESTVTVRGSHRRVDTAWDVGGLAALGIELEFRVIEDEMKR